MIVLPSYANFCKISKIEEAVKLSNPDVGSSSNKILGLFNSWIAMETLLFSPPEIPLINSLPIKVFAQDFKPNLLMISSTISNFLSWGNWPNLKSAATVKVSRTLRVANKWSSSWETYEHIELTILVVTM